jgi:hypothetical protein
MRPKGTETAIKHEEKQGRKKSSLCGLYLVWIADEKMIKPFVRNTV